MSENVSSDAVLYRSLVDNADSIIMRFDRNGMITCVNEFTLRFLGYSRDELVGHSVLETMAPSESSEGVEGAEGVEGSDQGGPAGLKSFLEGLLRDPETCKHHENGNLRKDGSVAWMSWINTPVRDKEGEIVEFLTIGNDATARKEAERAELRHRKYFEALAANMPAAAIMVDRAGFISSWNPEAEKLFGYREEEVIGKQIDELLVPQGFEEEARAFTKVSGIGGQFIRAFTRRMRKDRTLAEVELRAVPLLVDGETMGGMAIYHDISDLAQARREAEAANEAKSSFLATMSHEIRTPMNAVIGMTTLLLDTALDAEQKMFVETIRSSGESLLTIINDILDFSKIEAGRMDLEEQPFDLRECMESALDLVAAHATSKGLDIAYILEPGVPAAILGDSTRLRQVVLNLLSNSVKFTSCGEVVLTVSMAQGGACIPGPEGLQGAAGSGASGERVCLLFSVRDTGLGIPPDRMDRLFRSFSQVDTSTTRKFGGTGLGLAISRRLVRLMGGEMWVESEGIAGKGSVFNFTISAIPSLRPVPVFLHRQQPGLAGRHVLVVDDNATNRYILYRQLQSWGMIPEETEFPHEALEWIASGKSYDLVLLDMQMPGMDGATLGAAIQALDLGKKPELVMLTSSGQKDVDTAGLSLAAYLTKPIKPAVLFSTLQDIFGTRGANADACADTCREGPAGPCRTSGSIAGAGIVSNAGTGGVAGDLPVRPLRILLAEDNLVNKQVALLLLKRTGRRADVAGNGLEVLESLNRQPYEVILMDVQMPDMDGLEATRRIRASHPVFGQPYIIAMTANAMQGDRESCLAAGMDDYIGKPIRMDELTEALVQAETRIRREQEEMEEKEEMEENGERESGAGSPAVPGAAHPERTGASSREDMPACSDSLDGEILESLRRTIGVDDSETLKMLANDFIVETEDSLALMRRGDDAAGMARAAHSVKSSAMLFGASGLSALCRDMEEKLRTGGRGFDVASAVRNIGAEFIRVREDLLKLPGK